MGYAGVATPEHAVTLSSFYLSTNETTYALWHDVKVWADANDYTFANAGREGHGGTIGAAPTGASNEPVTTVNWRDAIVWCNARSHRAGLTPAYTYSGETITNSSDGTACDAAVFNASADGYRLPTEAEWEYAARHQDGALWTPGDYASGAGADYNDAPACQAVAWYAVNSSNAAHAVAGRSANQLGIHDMSGNVWEWCWDLYEAYGSGPDTDPTGPRTGSYRVMRGGSWPDPASYLRCAVRSYLYPSDTYRAVGFRCAMGL